MRVASRFAPSEPMRGTLSPPVVIGRHAPLWYGDQVHPAFWVATAALLSATVFGAPLTQSVSVTVASILFICGGLPHGAYDIALLRRSGAFGPLGRAMVLAGYVTIATAMALLWMTLPLFALILFLAVAAIHFGEDWQMLDEPLLRFAAGAAIIAAPTIAHPAEVTRLFVAMSDERATIVAQLVTAVAPATLLVTAVGIVIAWQNEHQRWAAAMILCLTLLMATQPVVAFALFFVFLHSPRHLIHTRTVLRDMSRTRWLATGALLSGAAVAGWLTLQFLTLSRIDENLTVPAFQLLASVAVPHLLLSRWLEHRLVRTDQHQEDRA